MKLKTIYGKSALLTFFLFCVSNYSFGQKGFSAYDMANGFNSFWPASVSASQLFNKPDENIDYATGRATIRIPLYEIRTADFVLPISISFNTGCLAKNQLAGQIGAGWQLEAEPMITRRVRGLPDEFHFLADSAARRSQYEYYALRLVAGQADFQEDIFYYRLLSGNSGFVLSESAERYFRPRLLTNEGTVVTVPGGRVNTTFSNSIIITDPSGNRYVFGDKSSARELTYQGGDESVTSWKASEIVSPGGDRIQFSYWDAAPLEYPYSRYDFYMVEDNFTELRTDQGVPPHPGYWKGVNGKMNYYYMADTQTDPMSGKLVPVFKKWDMVNNLSYSNPGSRVLPRPIQRIDFAGGSVRFSYGTRTGLLERIDVYSGNKILRSMRFTTTNSYLPFLSKVDMLGEDGKSTGHYFFGYSSYREGAAESSYNHSVGDQSYYGTQDYVHAQEVSIFRPSDQRTFTFSLGSEGNSYFPLIRDEKLRFVIYPSGGRTEYNYEYGHVNMPKGHPMGTTSNSYRLYSIVEHPVCGAPVTRKFRYGDSKSLNGVGYARFPVDCSAFRQEYRKHYIGRDNLGRYVPCSGRARLYSNQNQMAEDYLIYYPFVEETVNGISTLRHFPCYSNFEYGVASRFPDPIGYGQFLCMEDSCIRLRDSRAFSVRYSFPGDFGRKAISEMKMTSLFENGNLEEAARQSLSIMDLCLRSYQTNTVEVMQMEPQQASWKEKNLDGSDIASRKESRTYLGNLSGLLLNVSTDRERVEYSYPSSNLNKAAHVLMKARNELDIPVETRHYVDNVLRKRLVYDYEPDNKTARGYSLSAIRESTSTSGGTLRVVEQYHNYLRCGKPSQVTHQDGRITSIVWGYGGLHPIAFVEGMTSEAVASTGISLEAVAASHIIDESVYTRLDYLRRTHPEARVTTFRYRPMVGMVKRTDPDGSSESYSYDTSGRLSKTVNNNQKTVATYEYHEANQ